MVRPKSLETKPSLNVSINPQLYKKLKAEIGDRKVSAFVERAIAKELGEYDSRLEREQQEFQQKLIAGYKRDASKTPSSEDIM